MNTAIKEMLSSRPVQFFLYHLIRHLSSTLRMTVENEEEWLNSFQQGGRILLCAWHQQFFSVIRYFKKYEAYKPLLMISRSRDGDLIAGVASLTGWNPVRGSSSKGGKEALRVMIDLLKETGLAGHIMDGPRGPAGRVKPGAIRLALDAGAAVVPFYVAADRSWFFNSWDHFFIPKPFAKVTLTYGHPIHLSQLKDDQDFEMLRRHVEMVMRKELKIQGKNRSTMLIA